VSAPSIALRRYAAADEDAAIALWQRTWQAAYPEIDFAARVPWWRARWRNELVPAAAIVLAERNGILVGFVTVDRGTRYLDQLVVVPDLWGTDAAARLVDEAKRLSPAGLELHVNQDNPRAIRFYRKQGFVIAGPDANPISGRPTWHMAWRPGD
jgi:putative acetyltransferase